MKLIIIVSETKPGELIKLSPILAVADVVVENGVVVKNGRTA